MRAGSARTIAILISLTVITGARGGTVGWVDAERDEHGQVAPYAGGSFSTITDAASTAFAQSGAFADAGLLPSAVNLIFVDFSASPGSAANAGLTLFALWGTAAADPLPNITNSVLFGTPFITSGTDIMNPVAGASETYVWGGLTHAALGPSGMFVVSGSSQGPTGLALTNFGSGEAGSVLLDFVEGNGIEEWALFTDGEASPVTSGAFASAGDGSTLQLVIPAPTSIVVLAGMLISHGRRRRGA